MKQLMAVWGELGRLRKGLRAMSCGSARNRFALFLAFSGLLLLSYVAGQYWQTYAAQKQFAKDWQHQVALPPNHFDSDGGSLVRLIIPKMNLDAVVVEGTSGKALKLGPAHLQASALPGHAGNSVIAGHRDTFFRHLDDLKAGDQIDIRRPGGSYHFEVTSRRIVQSTDLSVLHSSTFPELTLITCYPMHYVGPAPQRLVVVASLMRSKP